MNSVQVLNQSGNKLAPCSPKRARILLERGNAIAIASDPFTIQLITDGLREKSQGLIVPTHNDDLHIWLYADSENQTPYMIQKGKEAAKLGKKVLFISTIYHETSLHRVIEGGGVQERYITISDPVMNCEKIGLYCDEFNPDMIIVDEWITKDELVHMRKMTKIYNVTLLLGISIRMKRPGMPMRRDVPRVIEGEAATIVSFYAMQCRMLKNRFGRAWEDKSVHRDHITLA